MILLFHYSGHAFDALLAGHFGGTMLLRLFGGRTGAPEFGGVSARLLQLLLLMHLWMVMLQLQLLLLLHLLLLLLLQVDPGPVVVGRGGCGFCRRRHRLFGRGAVVLPAEHCGQGHGTGHQVFGRAHGRVVVEPLQIHQVAEAAGRTLGIQHNTRSEFFIRLWQRLRRLHVLTLHRNRCRGQRLSRVFLNLGLNGLRVPLRSTPRRHRVTII